MKNIKTAAKKYPLVLILIGTTILAIPAAYGTFALFDGSPGAGANSIFVKDWLGKLLFFVSVSGFALFAGYILTAIFRRHSRIFWLCSALYNFGLSCCYGYFIFGGIISSFVLSGGIDVDGLKNPVILMPLWTSFVAASSVYYFRIAASTKISELP